MRSIVALVGLVFIACGDDGISDLAGSRDAGPQTPADGGPEGGRGGSMASGTGGRAGAAGQSAGRSGGGGRAASSGAGGAGSTAGTSGASGSGTAGAGTISAQYPGDIGITSDARVIFHSDFESGLEGFTSYTQDPSLIDVLDDPAIARGGSKYLRAQVTRTRLAQDEYVSAQAQFTSQLRLPQMHVRFYARFVGETAIPHHWVRIAAGNATFAADGRANTVPRGNEGAWFDLDVRRDLTFNFYVYWYKMRSGRCNDGSATPGCEGDQGTTYYYGNNFTAAGQEPFARDTWQCLEIKAKINTVGESDGELALYLNDELVAEYKPGTPRGRWLRDNFYSFGEYFEDQQAFEGFDFRSSQEVLWKRVTLDAYYERGSLDRLAETTDVPEAQVILYDDLVVATERIGCVVE